MIYHYYINHMLCYIRLCDLLCCAMLHCVLYVCVCVCVCVCVAGSESFRPDIQKSHQMENAVRDIQCHLW